jgi:hypothetical protein
MADPKILVDTSEVDDQQPTSDLDGMESPVDPSVDPFYALFDTDDADSNQVELYRTEPTHLDSVKISGFLGTLYPGADRQSIAAEHGGGTYRLSRRNSAGRFGLNRTLEISGRPIMPKPQKAPDGADAVVPTAKALTPEQSAFFDKLQETMLMKAALGGGDDSKLSGQLLQTLIEQNANRERLDLKNMLGGITAVFELVRNFSSEKSGGSDPDMLGMLTGLLGNALGKKAGAGVGDLPAVIRATPGTDDDPNASAPASRIVDVPVSDVNPTVQKEVPAMNPTAILGRCFQIVLNGFDLDQPVVTVTRLVSLELDWIPNIKDIVIVNDGMIRAGFAQCALENLGGYEPDSEIKKKFDLYSSEVMRRFLESDYSEPTENP